MKTSRNIILSLVLAGIVIGGFVLLAKSGTTGGTASLLINLSPGDWARGSANAKVTLIEYSDFQCPACGAYYPAVHQLMTEFGDRVKLVYREFPLREIHKHADLAAHAAEAAGKQGKFWEMHDKLFENQKAWADAENAEEIILGYASALGLNLDQFKNDINSQAITGKINKDASGGELLGVNGTPTFFLDGKRLQNPRSYDEFRNSILAELAATQ